MAKTIDFPSHDDRQHSPSEIVRLLDPWLVTDVTELDLNAPHELEARCPLHPDNAPSASLGLNKGRDYEHVWFCHACEDAGAVPVAALLDRIASGEIEPPDDAEKPARKPPKNGDPEPLPSEEVLRRWQGYLLDNTHNAFSRLIHKRGLTAATVKTYELGWCPTRRQSRFTIPVRDAEGALRNVRRWNGDLDPKIKSVFGHGKARLFPLNHFAEDMDDPVLFPEGELDALLLRQHGWPAVTTTGGAKAMRYLARRHADDLEWFRDRDVVILADLDDAGETAEQGIVRALADIARSVRVGRIPGERTKKGGKDVTDLWAEDPDAFHSVMEQVIEGAKEPEPDTATDESDQEAVNEREGRRPQTDLGNAERLIQNYGDILRYSHQRRKWFIWDGKRWVPDLTGKVERLAKATVRTIRQEAAELVDLKEREAVWKHARQSEARPRLAAMVSLASSERGIPILIDELDADPWLINFQNGTMDLRTGTLREHRPSDLMTKMVKVPYDPDAPCPRFQKFLTEVLPDPEVRALIKRVLGYSLTGITREQVIFMLWGGGSNGKSRLVDAVLKPLGDYGWAASSELLLSKNRNAGAATPEIANLAGRRMITTVETEEGRRLAESLVKQLTGEDRVNARHLHENEFQFDMQGKLFLLTNSKPLISGQGHSIWRRIVPIKFPVKFDGPMKDDSLGVKLAREAPGILRWAVEGCLEWQRKGLDPPLSVLADRDDYRQSQDTMGEFLEDRCTTDPGRKVRRTALYDEWEMWCRDNGLKPGSAQAFYRKMEERGFGQGRPRFPDGKQDRAFLGLDLRAVHIHASG